MEKKRRARINHSLDQLKSLLENYYSSSVSVRATTLPFYAFSFRYKRVLESKSHCEFSIFQIRKRKLEKADILELTVKHIRNLQKIQRCKLESYSIHVLRINAWCNFTHSFAHGVFLTSRIFVAFRHHSDFRALRVPDRLPQLSGKRQPILSDGREVEWERALEVIAAFRQTGRLWERCFQHQGQRPGASRWGERSGQDWGGDTSRRKHQQGRTEAATSCSFICTQR